jgi:lipoprotein signal peptidase
MWDTTQLQAINLLDLSIFGGVCKVVVKQVKNWQVIWQADPHLHKFTGEQGYKRPGF